MPAFDINRAYKVVHAEDGDDVGPVGVSETWGSVPYPSFAAAKAFGFKNVPGDGGVFSVNVVDLVHPFSELGDRINEGVHLVAGLPFEAESFTGDFVEHHFPGSWRVGNVPAWPLPSSEHIAVFECDFYAFVFSNFGKVAEDFFELGHGFIYRTIFECTSESTNDIAAKELGRFDKGFKIGGSLLVLERVSVDSYATDDAIGIIKELVDFLRGFGEINFSNVFSEREFEGFKTVGEDLLEVAHAFIHWGEGSDAYILVADARHIF